MMNETEWQACGHPWQALEWLDEETCTCRACAQEWRRQHDLCTESMEAGEEEA